MPALEPPPAGPAEDPAGTIDSNNCDTTLAISSLVSDNQDDGNRCTHADPSTSRSSSTRKRTRHSFEEPVLVADRLESKRRRLEKEGWHPSTVEMVLYRPLVRDIRFPNKSVKSDTISNHIAYITELLSLPESTKVRAIGPTEAIKNGARVDDVVVHGNWSSSTIFDRFYRLTSASAVNFTSLVLS
ncbi:MAG: hypothetical protein J3R72DRAFT_500048 [Linnemannia gamsii]|nr:MAG: hypothetical protein J3R72DRAFT_500048 [Linnemannia gamsii]